MKRDNAHGINVIEILKYSIPVLSLLLVLCRSSSEVKWTVGMSFLYQAMKGTKWLKSVYCEPEMVKNAIVEGEYPSKMCVASIGCDVVVRSVASGLGAAAASNLLKSVAHMLKKPK